MMQIIHNVEYRHLGRFQNTLAIVLVQNSVGEVTCRIGLVDQHSIDPKADNERILHEGGRLSKLEALAFFPYKQDLITERWKSDHD